MNEVLTILRTVFNQSNQYIPYRTSLNLPAYDGNFPFRQKQRAALDLALSNAPIVAIAGNPASGKTEIALAAVNMAIAHQRSTLIIAPFASTFTGYRQLSLPPLEITENQNYRQSVKAWLRQELSAPKLDFSPPHWLSDQLFEDLQTKRDRRFWLELLNPLDSQTGEQSEQTHQQVIEKIAKIIAELHPSIHPARQQLLVHRLIQAKALLQQREHLYQDYINLSDTALEQMTDAILPHFQAPILCATNHLSRLSSSGLDLIFDLVIVEDSHYFNTQEELQVISSLGKKLVFLGDLVDRKNVFGRLFQNLLPSYRVELTENHRLKADLARHVFPLLYPSYPLIYTATTQKSNSGKQGNSSISWHDIRNSTQFEEILENLLEKIFKTDREKIPFLLTFTQNSHQKLQHLKQHLVQKLPQSSQLQIYNIDNWHGRQCDNLWVICDQDADKNEDNQPDVTNLKLTNLRLALTRSSNQITFFGDRQYYLNQNVWQDLMSNYDFVRDIRIIESKQQGE